MNCPICECKKCGKLIVDLLICNDCSHIFKANPPKKDYYELSNPHLVDDPVKGMREHMEEHPERKQFMFSFPSLMFYTFELKPSKFYNSKNIHYFNQMSTMIFLDRCGLIPIEQFNVWSGRECHTRLLAEREGVE